MRIRIDRNPAKTSGLNFTEGQVVDVDDGIAQRLIKQGLATAVGGYGIEPIKAVPQSAELITAPVVELGDIRADSPIQDDESDVPAGIVFGSEEPAAVIDEGAPEVDTAVQQPQKPRRR